MKHKRRLKMWPMVTLFLIIIFGILIYCIIDMKNSLGSKGVKKIEVLEEISKYGYSLNENDSKYFKDEFKKLKNLLSKEDFDEEEYAKDISKLFLIDFFTLNNTINKNDVGGVQFIYKDYQDDFIKYAKDTVYKYIENDIYNKRKQELPVVTNVEVTDIKKESYSSKKLTDDNAYYVSLKIEYETDLDYQTVATLVLAHSNDKLEIVSMK